MRRTSSGQPDASSQAAHLGYATISNQISRASLRWTRIRLASSSRSPTGRWTIVAALPQPWIPTVVCESRILLLRTLKANRRQKKQRGRLRSPNRRRCRSISRAKRTTVISAVNSSLRMRYSMTLRWKITACSTRKMSLVPCLRASKTRLK